MVISRTSADAPNIFSGIPVTLAHDETYQEKFITRVSPDIPIQISARNETKRILTRTGTVQRGLQQYTSP